MEQIDAGEPASYAKVVSQQDRHLAGQQPADHLNIDYLDNQQVGIRPPKVIHFHPCRYRQVQDQ